MVRLAISAMAVLAGLAGCERAPEAPPAPEAAITVVVRPTPLRLRSGESRQLSAQANDVAGTPIGGAPLAYSSRTPALLNVSPSGLVSSVGPAGSGQIEVTSGKVNTLVDVTIGAGSTDALRATSGDKQSGVAGTVVADAIAVRAEDVRGNPVPGVVIRFASEAEGIAAPSEATTDDQGIASSRWTLGPRAGTQSLIVSVADAPEVSATFTATAQAGPPVRIERYGDVGELVAAGESLLAQVRVLDDHDNPVEAVPVTWTDDDGGHFGDAATVTDAQGAASASWFPRPLVGERRARVVTSALAEQSVELITTVRAGAAARLEVVAGDGQRGTAGKAAPVAAAVRVVDAHGNPVANAPVSFAVAAGTGSVDVAPVVTDEAGVAMARAWVLGPGANTLSASLAGVEGSASVTATGRGRR